MDPYLLNKREFFTLARRAGQTLLERPITVKKQRRGQLGDRFYPADCLYVYRADRTQFNASSVPWMIGRATGYKRKRASGRSRRDRSIMAAAERRAWWWRIVRMFGPDWVEVETSEGRAIFADYLEERGLHCEAEQMRKGQR